MKPPSTPPRCFEVDLDAIASAFALIACSDAELGPGEVERFREVIRQGEACQGLDLEEIERTFHTLSQALLKDYGAGKHRALELIAKVVDDPRSKERVIAAAQIAIVADGQLCEVEEQALREICEVLGVDPEGI